MAMKCWSVVRLKKKLNNKKRRFYNEAVSKIEAAFFVKRILDLLWVSYCFIKMILFELNKIAIR